MQSPIKNYTGSKGGAGVYQRIINKIPDTSTLVIPFLGSGQILTRLDLSRYSSIYINDFDGHTVEKWETTIKLYNQNTGRYHIELFNCDFEEFLENRYSRLNDAFIYLDPPYLLSTRNNNIYYKKEFSDKDHTRLLEYIGDIDHKYMINHPICDIYKYQLEEICSTEEYDYMTRGGMRKDCLWYNYDPAGIALNTYKYLGDNFTKRQQIKRKINNVTNKLDRLDFHSRDYIIRSVIEKYGY